MRRRCSKIHGLKSINLIFDFLSLLLLLVPTIYLIYYLCLLIILKYVIILTVMRSNGVSFIHADVGQLLLRVYLDHFLPFWV